MKWRLVKISLNLSQETDLHKIFIGGTIQGNVKANENRQKFMYWSWSNKILITLMKLSEVEIWKIANKSKNLKELPMFISQLGNFEKTIDQFDVSATLLSVFNI